VREQTNLAKDAKLIKQHVLFLMYGYRGSGVVSGEHCIVHWCIHYLLLRFICASLWWGALSREYSYGEVTLPYVLLSLSVAFTYLTRQGIAMGLPVVRRNGSDVVDLPSWLTSMWHSWLYLGHSKRK